MAWWHDESALRRFVHDLVVAELVRLRPGGIALPERPWPDDFAIGAEGLGADSLELLGLSAALAEALQIARSGLEDGLLARRTLGSWLEICAAALARFDDEIVFRSSGSTGTPKSLVHRLDSLEQEIDTLACLLPGRRVLSTVPSHHIYGFLFTILLPQRLGVPVRDISQSTPASLGGALRSGDIIVGHPAWWHAFLRAAPILPPGVLATTSTAPCPRETFEELRRHGFSRVVEIYGSSETGGVGWRDDPDGLFTLMAHWQHDDADDGLVRTLSDGTKAASRLPDLLRWLDARHFSLLSRHDDAVQVGGLNVFPLAVRDKLRRHELVADATVRLMRADEGERLKAFIVPRPDRDSSDAREDLVRWIERTLPVAERPKSLTFGVSLPVGHFGKLTDW